MQERLEGRFLGELVGRRTFSNFSIINNRYLTRQELEKHSHERAFVSIALRGSYVEYCGGISWDCSAGHAIFHVPGEVHSNVFGDAGGRVLNVEIHPHFIPTLKEYGVKTDCRHRIDTPHALKLGKQLQQELCHPDSASELATEGLALQLLAELLRAPTSPMERRPPSWVGRVKDMLHSCYREPFRLSDLARKAGVHPVHLARTFSKQYGCSVGEYVRRLRIAAACHELANSHLSIADIASRNGFSDQSHLTRALTRHAGFSPARYRQSVASNAKASSESAPNGKERTL
jgi:AraC family transcriptional regulator